MSGWETPLSARKRGMYPPSPMSGTPVGKILRSSSIVPSSSRSTQSMSGTPGSVLGTGEYACVVPGDICSSSTNKPVFTHNMVSKIVEDQDEIDKINTTTQQLQTVPNWDTVLIHPLYSCTIDQPPTGCTKKGTSPLSVFVMRQGIPLNKYSYSAIEEYKNNLYNAVRTCLFNYRFIFHTKQNSIEPSSDINWLHGDIRIDNIVILEDGTTRLIDYNPYSKRSTKLPSEDNKRIKQTLIELLENMNIYIDKKTVTVDLLLQTRNIDDLPRAPEREGAPKRLF